jgi:hypothetical protein
MRRRRVCKWDPKPLRIFFRPCSCSLRCREKTRDEALKQFSRRTLRCAHRSPEKISKSRHKVPPADPWAEEREGKKRIRATGIRNRVFGRGALEIFRGALPPQRSDRRKTCLSARGRELVFRQRSEDVLGRKISSATAKACDGFIRIDTTNFCFRKNQLSNDRE